MICIYCRRTAVAFTVEHVIPRAFGTFGPQTMVLPDMVCGDCNREFGRRLDLFLARDSHEGLLRVDKLSSSRPTQDKFKRRRTTIMAPDDPSWGAYRGARLDVDWARHSLYPFTQIILLGADGKRRSFSCEEFEELDDAVVGNLPPGSVRLLGRGDEFDRLRETAERKGVRFTSERAPVEQPPATKNEFVALDVDGRIDAAILRAVAKVAFNYLACCEGASFVLRTEFDGIRAFIAGLTGENLFVGVNEIPILASDTRRQRAAEHHLVMYQRDGSALLGRVSLFNFLTYDVVLASDLGLYYRLQSGHAFDWKACRIYPLTGVPTTLTSGLPLVVPQFEI